MTETILLEQFVDPCGAHVLLDTTPDGQTVARFDLSAMPRLEPMLIGREAAGVPELVKRLCGICPIPHHLAGVMALEGAVGRTPPPLAMEVRRLVAHTATMTTLAPRFFQRYPQDTRTARMIAKQAATWGGCPGHFPNVAAPGGLVRAPEHPWEELGQLSREAADAAARWDAIAEELRDQGDVLDAGTRPEGFADVWLVDSAGEPDPLGGVLAVRTGHPTATEAVTSLPAHTWPEVITETHPGAAAPRMTITVDGHDHPYRTGPLARHTGHTPRAAHAASIAASLRGIQRSATTLTGMLQPLGTAARHALLDSAVAPALETDELAACRGTGVGVVDSPRGLLAHVYQVDKARLTSCAIHTPTAQNEWWLSHLLTQALGHGGDMRTLEDAIRAADPCVPATDAPPGAMPISTTPAPAGPPHMQTR
ncbi:hypothetical protein C1Y63_08895 [Corynebacterium sp. 13CS0277]|uniref:nickel-dependent hydrogenase large subunit n=1 Tax=Corynebacterium sp. 13CS0277 TaxID=2071994 RepID=UPI000D0377BD|nr:nickel-dependent hydrogenase large subunit [Corynebacterium sp. 13CS0277]PRQ10971.1 hypothetical protein C1Y63_08895 [Corynebacterium sp. 13CS0277]